jgi:hypothetical protein
MDDLKEMTGYGKLKEEALDRILWRTRFVVRHYYYYYYYYLVSPQACALSICILRGPTE